MDSAHYEQMIYKQLEDKNIQKKVDTSYDNKTMRANNALIKKYENSFLKQEVDYLGEWPSGLRRFTKNQKGSNLTTRLPVTFGSKM